MVLYLFPRFHKIHKWWTYQIKILQIKLRSFKMFFESQARIYFYFKLVLKCRTQWTKVKVLKEHQNRRFLPMLHFTGRSWNVFVVRLINLNGCHWDKLTHPRLEVSHLLIHNHMTLTWKYCKRVTTCVFFCQKVYIYENNSFWLQIEIKCLLYCIYMKIMN